jgi:hypothetical protein
VRDGKEVVANGLGVLQIRWDEEKMRRKVNMESIVLALSEARFLG